MKGLHPFSVALLLYLSAAHTVSAFVSSLKAYIYAYSEPTYSNVMLLALTIIYNTMKLTH